jgi:Bax protein
MQKDMKVTAWSLWNEGQRKIEANLNRVRKLSIKDSALVAGVGVAALCVGVTIGAIRGELALSPRHLQSDEDTAPQFQVAHLKADAAMAASKALLARLNDVGEVDMPALHEPMATTSRKTPVEDYTSAYLADVQFPVITSDLSTDNERLFDFDMPPSTKPPTGTPIEKHLRDVPNVDGVERTFAELQFELDKVRTGDAMVPRLYLAKFPADVKSIRSPQDRKSMFFRTILPLILRANEAILEERKQVMQALDRVGAAQATAEDHQYLADIAEAFGAKSVTREDLLARVDMVPPSLALAQSAEESGWGTSRFARQGNAIFGQKTFKKNDGIRPKGREANMGFAFRSFNDLYASIRSYMHNLNSHRAYREMRAVRAKLRSAQQPADGRILLQSLVRYSERGADYIKTIDTIIRINKLQQLDDARLSAETVAQNATRTAADNT